MGISGILGRATGTTLYWPKVPQWLNVPVQRIFADHFGFAPEIEDTPRTMALAERRLGLARQAENWVYVMIGASMGSAIFVNPELYGVRLGVGADSLRPSRGVRRPER